jgi:LysM repeat protein
MARTYVVKRGDTLARIAKAQLGDANLYLRIAELNGMRDPNHLAPGQRLEIPLPRELAAPPAAEAPHGFNAVIAEYGDIYAYLRDDGSLDPRWETEQLARAPLPFPIALSWDPTTNVRSICCHRKLAKKFQEVFAEIERRGLSGKVRTYGGCFNVRAKRSGSKLSTHAWGIAVDLNPETNMMGREGDMPAGIVAAFKRSGFLWGGDWKGAGKDPMHFQYCSGY